MFTPQSGFLLVIEGIDGSGKSSLATALYHQLQKEYSNVLLTKEPGGSTLGKQLRNMLQQQDEVLSGKAEFLLFAADRAQHITTVIKPALAQKAVIISDRMSDSSLVYQGYGRGLDQSMITLVNKWVMEEVRPQLTIYLRVPLSVAHQRLQTRKTLTAFEKDSTFIRKVYEGFEALYKQPRPDLLIIDGTQSMHNVLQIAYEHTTKAIQSNG